jgi:hypothetical protein
VIAHGLRASGLPVVETTPEETDADTGVAASYRVVIVVAGDNRKQAISLVEQLGRSTRRPCVVLVVEDLTRGEYETLVNFGPVRHVFNDSDPPECIMRGVRAAIRGVASV